MGLINFFEILVFNSLVFKLLLFWEDLYIIFICFILVLFDINCIVSFFSFFVKIIYGVSLVIIFVGIMGVFIVVVVRLFVSVFVIVLVIFRVMFFWVLIVLVLRWGVVIIFLCCIRVNELLFFFGGFIVNIFNVVCVMILEFKVCNNVFLLMIVLCVILMRWIFFLYFWNVLLLKIFFVVGVRGMWSEMKLV